MVQSAHQGNRGISLIYWVLVPEISPGCQVVKLRLTRVAAYPHGEDGFPWSSPSLWRS